MQSDHQTALNDAQKPNPDHFVPRADYDTVKGKLDTALNTINEHKTSQVETVVDAAIKDGKIAPSSKDFYVAACSTEDGLESFKKMISGTQKIVSDKSETDEKSEDSSVALNSEQQSIFSQMGLDPSDKDVQAELKSQA